ncbi:MAG: DASS family sodium-coupled anion symporter [Parvibaculum sp.]
MTFEDAAEASFQRHQMIGLFLGPLVALVMFATPAPGGLQPTAWMTAIIAVWMAIWWVTEALPLAATALLVLVMLPLLGVSDFKTTAAPFAHPIVYLFLGGFMVAIAMQRWNLHRRIALHVLVRSGVSQTRLLAGVMIATAMISMWISNTATAMMMMPIALSLATFSSADRSEKRNNMFAAALMLATAYAASIGGLSTLVGSTPNALVAAFMAQTYGYEIGFAQWMLMGLPVTFLMLPITWFVLSKVVFKLESTNDGDPTGSLQKALDDIGPITTPERRVAFVFSLVAGLWMFRPFLPDGLGLELLSDSGIAILGTVLLFLIPAGRKHGEFLLDWQSAKEAPFDLLILFGGGLSLAHAVDHTGLATWIGQALSILGTLPLILLIAATAALIISLTELTSNTATAAAFLPVVGAVAVEAGIPPQFLTLPAALAATCAFMLPVATPPNAIVFGSGAVQVGQMIRAGIWLNLAGVIIITGMVAVLGDILFS